MMAIKSEVFGECVGEMNVSVVMENRCMPLLWVEIFEVYLGGESGSRKAVEVGDGARYWICF